MDRSFTSLLSFSGKWHWYLFAVNIFEVCYFFLQKDAHGAMLIGKIREHEMMIRAVLDQSETRYSSFFALSFPSPYWFFWLLFIIINILYFFNCILCRRIPTYRSHFLFMYIQYLIFHISALRLLWAPTVFSII